MDKSLDDIVSASRVAKQTRRPRRGNNVRVQVLGTTGTSPAAKARISSAVKTASASPQPVEKIVVSNLPPDVNEAQVKELFQATVGALREVNLHYDASGRSKGVASVIFQKKGDGNKAYQQYNNRLIDGKRPMKIEVVVDPSRLAPTPSLASRVAPVENTAVVTNGTQAARSRGGAPRGRGRRQGSRKTERPQKTVEDLDAEMEDYTTSSAAPAAAAAA
jgi:THO complex subunit 4